jgi:hypothetical protein
MLFIKKFFFFFLSALIPVTATAQVCQANTIPATSPTKQFSINSNGTVTDIKTGLIWKKCFEGQSSLDCSDKGVVYTWQQALEQAQIINKGGGFAGYDDWRLPNVKELVSITEKQCVFPGINLILFPNTPSQKYWTSSPVANKSENAWYVHFDGGHSGYITKSTFNYVRLVRG